MLASPLARGMAAFRGSAPPQHVGVFLARRALVQQLVAGLLRERLEVAQRAVVGGHHLEHLAACHGGERLLGLQDGQWAVEPAGVDFLVDVHRRRLPGEERKNSRAARAAPALQPGLQRCPPAPGQRVRALRCAGPATP